MRRAGVAVVLVAGLWPATVWGESEALWEAGEQAGEHATESSSDPARADQERRLLLFPEGHLFDLVIADPHRPGAAVNVASYRAVDVDGATDQRFFLRVGGRFGLVRRLPTQPEGRSWQLSLEAGLDGQFDMTLGQDNIGWDGNYGLTLSTARARGRWAALVGLLHTSAHIGDEWIQRTGRERINYTREEIRAAVARRFARRWRAYGELAYAYQRRAFGDLIKPLRAQSGLELEQSGGIWRGRAGWYAAADVQAWEERDWRIDVALQAGLLFERGSRTWRVGIDFHDGRVPLGEFFQDTESAVSLGLWSEL